MDLTGYLIVGLAALGGLFLYEKSKRKSAEALNENVETKEKLNELNKDIIKNEALNEAEEEKRKQIEKESEEKKNEKVDRDNLLDWLNKPK